MVTYTLREHGMPRKEERERERLVIVVGDVVVIVFRSLRLNIFY